MLQIQKKPSPNFDDRRNLQPNILLMHYTGMETAEAALERLVSEEAQVSAHYFVDEDGAVTQMVEEGMRAWHAGVSYWQGESNINTYSVGIEIVNPGHEFGYRSFPDAQIEAVIELSKGILERNPAIPAHRVLAHSDVAPSRKEDPGELFPWAHLADEGIGSWVSANEVAPKDLAPVSLGEEGAHVSEARQYLAIFGYDAMGPASCDEKLSEIIRAFHRHYAPEKLDDPFDGTSLSILVEHLKRIEA